VRLSGEVRSGDMLAFIIARVLEGARFGMSRESSVHPRSLFCVQ
jgi:hypothetical protein